MDTVIESAALPCSLASLAYAARCKRAGRWHLLSAFCAVMFDCRAEVVATGELPANGTPRVLASTPNLDH